MAEELFNSNKLFLKNSFINNAVVENEFEIDFIINEKKTKLFEALEYAGFPIDRESLIKMLKWNCLTVELPNLIQDSEVIYRQQERFQHFTSQKDDMLSIGFLESSDFSFSELIYAYRDVISYGKNSLYRDDYSIDEIRIRQKNRILYRSFKHGVMHNINNLTLNLNQEQPDVKILEIKFEYSKKGK